MIFILTATVNVFFDVHPSFSNSVVRRSEYIENLKFLSSNLIASSFIDSEIYFIENSSDLVENFDLYPDLPNVKYITFDQDLNSMKGKGYCEIQMIDHILKTVQSCSFFIKVTGRYSISNWQELLISLQSVRSPHCLLGTEEINYISNQFSSRFFLCSIPFWKSVFMQTMLSKVNDNHGYFIEHALFDLSLFCKPLIFNVLPSKNASSATTSSSLRISPFLRYIKKFVYFLVRS